MARRAFDEIWRYQRTLRRVEYLYGTKANVVRRLLAKWSLRRQGVRLGFTIHPGNFGPGLSIAHHGTITVNAGARIGKNCRIHPGVGIGTAAGQSDAAPTLGDNCYIGPGAKLIGPIHIGANTAIGANAVVNKSFADGNVTLGGVPAKVISEKTSDGLLTKGAS